MMHTALELSAMEVLPREALSLEIQQALQYLPKQVKPSETCFHNYILHVYTDMRTLLM